MCGVITLLFLGACQKESNTIEGSSSYSPEISNPNIDAFQQKLSTTLSSLSRNKSFISSLKLKAASSTGKRSVLLIPALSVEFLNDGETTTLRNFLQSEKALAHRSVADLDGGLIENLLSISPTTQLTFYSPEGMNPSLWGSVSTPKIGYHSAVNPGVVYSYMGNGEFEEISYYTKPTVEYLVVNHSEKLISTSQFEHNKLNEYVQTKISPVFFGDNETFYLESDFENTRNDAVVYSLRNGTIVLGPFGPDVPNGTDGPPLGPRTGDCDRDKNELKDYLTRFKFANENAYKEAKDGWFNDKLEMRCDIVFSVANGAVASLAKTFTVEQGDVKNLEWYDLDLDIVNWDPDTYGSAMKYLWSEKGLGSGTSETTVKFTTKDANGNTTEINHKVVRPKNLTELGESLGDYCDAVNNGETYNTGKVVFEIDLD